MMQYVPKDGVYVYFRYDDGQTVMVAMNTSKEQKIISPGDYLERTTGFTKMKNVIMGDVSDLKDFSVDAGSAVVLELLQ